MKENSDDVVKSYLNKGFKSHGLTDSTVSYRDPKFTSKFWEQLMKFCDVRTKMYTSHHPQTDGSLETMNLILENYLRCYCSFRQDDSEELLEPAQLAYNSSCSEELQASKFEADLGYNHRGTVYVGFQTDT